MKFTLEEQSFMKRLDVDTLRFFMDIKDHKSWTKMVDFFTKYNDIVKEAFFETNELNMTEENLKARHAYSRGQISALVTVIRLFSGASQELKKREEEYEKRKQEIKEK